MSNLFERYGEPCVKMERVTIKDPLGGYKTEWIEGVDFVAAISPLNTSEAQIAEAQGMHRIFNVAVDRSLEFKQNDVFKRVSDGQTFRATSHSTDMQTPPGASVPNTQFTAEAWEIPPE